MRDGAATLGSAVYQLVCVATFLAFAAFVVYWANRVGTTASEATVARFASTRGWVSRPAAGWVFRYEGELDGVPLQLGRQVSPRSAFGKPMPRPVLEVSTPLSAPGCIVIEQASPLARGLVSTAERCGVTRPSRVELLTLARDVPATVREGFEVRVMPGDHPLATGAAEVASLLGAHLQRTLRSVTVLVMEGEMHLISRDPLAGPEEVVTLAARCHRALTRGA